MRLLRICEAFAAGAVAISVLIVIGVAVSRFGFGYTPVWSEPVVGLLIFFAVCAALPPGLNEGVHVSIHVLDRFDSRNSSFWRDIVVYLLCLALGVVMAASAAVYTGDTAKIGLRDYAGIPQSYSGVLACTFGVVIALYSAIMLVRVIRGRSIS